MKEIDKVYEYEMDPIIIVEDTERTRRVEIPKSRK